MLCACQNRLLVCAVAPCAKIKRKPKPARIKTMPGRRHGRKDSFIKACYHQPIQKITAYSCACRLAHRKGGFCRHELAAWPNTPKNELPSPSFSSSQAEFSSC